MINGVQVKVAFGRQMAVELDQVAHRLNVSRPELIRAAIYAALPEEAQQRIVAHAETHEELIDAIIEQMAGGKRHYRYREAKPHTEAPAPQTPPIADILDLDERGYGVSAIAAIVKVRYSIVREVLSQRGSNAKRGRAASPENAGKRT